VRGVTTGTPGSEPEAMRLPAPLPARAGSTAGTGQPPGFAARLHRYPGSVAALTLAGELDAVAVPRLRGLLDDVRLRPPAGCLLDMAQLTFLDCAGLRAVRQFTATCRARPGSWLMVVHSPAAVVGRLLEITRLEV
jgi:anti-anti-sigma factor